MITASTKEGYTTEVNNGRHHIVVDEPLSVGGADKGLTPTELLHSSLAACSTITMRMYVDRKEWKVDEIIVHTKQKTNLATKESTLEKNIEIIGELDEKQLERVHVISKKCPIHKLLVKSIAIESTIKLKS